ncbi:pal1-like protein [Diaporthe amygdali]|uniref:pal1-like protein n=1 Tax=Phomopsis amygdali TaxID=1214568 RepID=UPI0022FEA83B|nr:pal1-like protein [Diaporthe amygdali]KAJ0107382.1 pal1-like protein [Diaporthe amygdali]
MASGWFGSKAIELVRARSLFVNVSPTPTSLSERRAVLHALKRHGSIEIFKRLPSPETFVCAPTKTEVATELVKRSPLTFRFVSETPESVEEKAKPGIHPTSVASPMQVHEDKGNSSTSVANSTEPRGSGIVKTFTVRINPSQSYYEHKKNIRLSPTHGAWPKTHTGREDQDFVYFALKDVVPNNIAQEGLCDWHTGSQLSGESASMRAQAADARLWHIKERQMRKRNKAQGTQAHLGGDLTAVTSLGALGGSTDEARRERPVSGLQRGTGADSTNETGSATTPTPAWIRRAQFSLNPLADGKHHKISKRIGHLGQRYEWKSVFNREADTVNLPETPREPLDGKG